MNHEARARAALKQLIKTQGGSRYLAEALGVSRQAVEHWDLIPITHLPVTKQKFGLGLKELRPDVAQYL